MICEDDDNSKHLKGQNVAYFGLSKKADVYASNIKEYKPCYYSFDVTFSGFKLGNIKLNILGRHNIYNALACVLVSIACAIDFCDIKKALESFSGVKRRCEKIKEINGASIYHDYAHHPKQIKKMIQVGRELTASSNGRVIVVFEPHTYSRTKLLIDEFAKCFTFADMVIFAPVYSAREKPSAGYDSLILAEETKKNISNVLYIDSFKKIKEKVLSEIKSGDVVLILGAGTIEKLADMF